MNFISLLTLKFYDLDFGFTLKVSSIIAVPKSKLGLTSVSLTYTSFNIIGISIEVPFL